MSADQLRQKQQLSKQLSSNELGCIEPRRISSVSKFQEKSFTKYPEHLKNATHLEQIDWIPLIVYICALPIISIYGLFTHAISRNLMILSIVWYFMMGISITAGYHRLWAHKSYKAATLLQMFFMLCGSATLQGSAYNWILLHRVHHRYTDTDTDPYNFKRGFWFAHFGWLICKIDKQKLSQTVNMRDIRVNPILAWQHKHFIWFGPFMCFIFPTLISYLLLDDIRGGFYIVATLTCFITQQVTHCINSVAHSNILFGKQPYDDAISPHDSPITALLTLGEGYHNFHHEFPNDYRNAVQWYQYDPTKWFINVCTFFGLAYDLNFCDGKEIEKSEVFMIEKNVLTIKEKIKYDTIDTIHTNRNQLQDGTKFVDDNHPGSQTITKIRNNILYNYFL